MSQAVKKFTRNSTDSPKLNNVDTRPLKPVSALSIPELCQEFVNLHTTGHAELARVYFAELVKRDHFQEAMQALAGKVGGNV